MYSSGPVFISYSLHQRDQIDAETAGFKDDHKSSTKYHLEGGNLNLFSHVYFENGRLTNPVDLDSYYDAIHNVHLYNELFDIIDAEKTTKSECLQNRIRKLNVFKEIHLVRWLYDENGVSYSTNRLTNDHLLPKRVTQIRGPDGSIRDDLIPKE